MLDNDISNEISPRFMFQWEGLIARYVEPDPYRKILHSWPRKAGKATYQINQFEFDGRMVAHLWDIQWRSRYSIDIVSFLGDWAEEPIKRRLDDAHIPYANFIMTTPERLARELAYMPHIYAVYFGDPNLALTFGGRGRHVPDATVFRLDG